MEGYILNKCGKSVYIFKRKFPVGHRIYLDTVWPLYATAIKEALEKDSVSEEEFVKWLEGKGLMRDGFEYNPGEKESMDGAITDSSDPSIGEVGSSADGRLARPALANAPRAMIEKLTYSDIAELRIVDDPARVLSMITNVHKLRRAYTKIRTLPRKRNLERLIRHRIQELERLC